jgi:hypothetical protein
LAHTGPSSLCDRLAGSCPGDRGVPRVPPKGPAVGRTAGAAAGIVLRLHGMDAFWVLTLLALAAVPLALSLRNVEPGGGAPAGH